MSAVDLDAAVPPRTRRSVDVPGGLVVGILLAIALYALDPDGALGELGFLVTYAGAATLAWVGVARHPADRRGPWACVAAGVTVTMVGDLLHEVVLGAPDGATISDGLWVAAYLALLVGLLRLEPLGGTGSGIDVDAVIDSLVALVVGVLVAWELALSRLVVDAGSSALDRVVAGTYPLLDVVLLAVVVRLLLRGDRSRPIVLVSAGSLVLLVADLAFATSGDGAFGTGLTIAWMAALLMLAASTLPGGAGPGAEPNARLRMWLVLAPLAVPIGLLVRGGMSHDHPNTGLVLAGTVALLGLAAVRAQRLLTAVEEARSAVQAREHRYRAMAANASDAVCVTDADGVVRWGGESLARLLGADTERMAGASASDEALLVDVPAVQRLHARVRDAPGVVLTQDVEVRAPDGSHRWWEVHVVNLLTDPVVAGIVANIRDVTERRHTEDELRARAFHDAVTGLANRALLRDRGEHAFRRAARRGTDPAVVHLQLDGLRLRGDQLGPDGGDRLLRQVAERLLSAVRSEDTVARVGDHELAVLIEENHAQTAEAATTADRIAQVLSTPLELDGQQVPLTVRIGLAVGDAGTTIDDLLRHAAIALDKAAEAGAPVVAYRAEMGAEADERAAARASLPHAIERGQLELRFEPVVRLADGTVIGFETHLWWCHPELGMLPAARFLPLAEDGDLAPAIGRWVLAEACAAAATWPPRSDGSTSTVGVHLASRHQASGALVPDVREALDRAGLDPSTLVLEVAEPDLIADADHAADRLGALAALGVRIAIDDFGTGSSSLAHLRRLPIEIMKVDRTFVETIDPDAEDAPAIVRGLVDLGTTLGLEIVAEGVADPAQRDALRRAGCPLGQGPLFSPPVTASEAALLVGERLAPAG